MVTTNLQRGYFTTEEAAHYSGVSQKRLEKMRCAGGGPRYFKRGRSVRYSLADLDEWMHAGAQCSTSDLAA